MSAEESLNVEQKSMTELKQDRDDDDDESSTLSTFSEHQPGRDRLTTLPPELLSIIFDFVREQPGSDHPQMRGVICESLFHFLRKNLYQIVTLRSCTALKLFERTIVAPGDHAAYLASLVQSFMFDLRSWDIKAYQWTEEIEQMPGSVCEGFDSVAFFASLPSVTRVNLSFCPLLTEALLSPNVAGTHLSQLQMVFITGHTPEVNLFDLSFFANLRHYPKLEFLSLAFERNDTDNRVCFELPCYLFSDGNFPLTRLDLVADFSHTSDARLADFLQHFSHLSRLEIIDESGTIDFDQVLQGATAGLVKLGVSYSSKETADGISSSLRRFRKLKTLHLGHGTYDANTLYTLRECYLLEKAWFGGYGDVWRNGREMPHSAHLSYDTMIRFLKERPASSSLREIELDFIDSGRIGERLADFDHLPTHPGETSDWHLPAWPENFSFNEAKLFLTDAKASGLAISGSIIGAIEVQEEWDKEITSLTLKLVERDVKERLGVKT